MTFERKESIIQYISAAFLLLACFFSLGYHHFDEHFQIFEFAAHKLGIVAEHELPWEYGAKMRPTIQPSMVYFTHRFFDGLGILNPFHIALLFRIASAILTFYMLKLMYATFKHHFKDYRLSYCFLLLSFLTWFIIYNGVRFSSENWSTIFFFIPFALYFKWEEKSNLQFFFLGILLGLSFVFRFQVAFMTIGFLAWLTFIKREKWLGIISLMVGGLVVIFLGILCDSWFYGDWVISPYNYFYENIIDDKSSHFGVMPWYWYFGKFFIQGIPPISLLFISGILFFLVKKPKSVFSWSLLPFLLAHMYVSHKELRFLFPLVGFLPFMLTVALAELQNSKALLIKNKLFLFFIKLSLVVNFIFVIVVSLRPADPHIALYSAIYNNYDRPINFYYVNNNPYHRILEIRYYKRENLEIKQLNQFEDIPPNENCLVVFGGKQRADEAFEKNNYLVYSTFPKWIKYFDFNNWQKRTKIWSVYEMNKPTEQ